MKENPDSARNINVTIIGKRIVRVRDNVTIKMKK